MNHENSHVPALAREVARRLKQATGLLPEITRTGSEEVLLTLASDRVALTITYRRKGTAGYQQVRSTLEVDGKSRLLARNFGFLVKLFADPDGTSEELNIAQSGPSPVERRRITHTFQRDRTPEHRK